MKGRKRTASQELSRMNPRRAKARRTESIVTQLPLDLRNDAHEPVTEPRVEHAPVNQAVLAAAIYQNNARVSPLFRLPAEIRNLIYRYAYCEKTLTVIKHSPGDPPYSGPVELHRPEHENTRFSVFVFNFDDEATHSDRFVIPVASKQFFHEAQAVTLTNAIFHFENRSTFRAFALSGKVSVPFVHYLHFDLRSQHELSVWREVMTYSIIGRFKKLRGVHLNMTWHNWVHPNDMRMNVWGPKLNKIANPFQQFKLSSEDTSVNIRESSVAAQWRIESGHGLDKLKREILARLLKYTPRRLSRRGQETE